MQLEKGYRLDLYSLIPRTLSPKKGGCSCKRVRLDFYVFVARLFLERFDGLTPSLSCFGGYRLARSRALVSQEHRCSAGKKDAEELHARIRESDAAHKERLADLRAWCESEVRRGAKSAEVDCWRDLRGGCAGASSEIAHRSPALALAPYL